MAEMMRKQEVVELLKQRGVDFDIVEHEAVFTMEGMDVLALPFANEVVKNLFLRDDKKRNYYLVVMPEDKPANIKELRASLEARPLRFASEDDLAKYLGVIAGAVTPFGALNDPEGIVQVVFDEDLRSYSGLGVHPNDNTATLHVPLDAILSIYDEREIPYRFISMSA